MTDTNPFDETQAILTPEEEAGLAAMPRPSLLERFRANEEQAWYTGTLAGATKGQTVLDYQRDRAVARYDSMSQWETPLEGVAALAGQLWGSAQTPETLVGELGLGARAAEAVGVKGAGFMARFFAGAVDAGVVNAGTDVVIQRVETAGGDRTAFDPAQTAVAAGLGAVIGGAANAVSKAAGAAADGGDQAAPPKPEAKATPEAAPARPQPVAEPRAEAAPAAADAGVAADGLAAPAGPTAVVAQDVLALGDVLDHEARQVRGMPARPAAAPTAPKARAPDVQPPAAKPAADVLPALAQGPHAGQLKRDAAGVAAQPADIAEPPQFVRLKQVAEDLGKALQATAVRMGRVAMPKAEGTFNLRSGVIRLKKPDDFDVLAHELGHHVEQHIGGDVKTLMKAHAGELQPMAYAGANPKFVLEEGFAEYMRTMVTNPAYAKAHAPVFDSAFRAMLAEKHSDVGHALDAAATAWRAWLEQPSATAVASTIVSSARPALAPKLRKDLARLGLGNTIAEYMNRFYAAAFDDLHPVARAVRGLAQVYTENTGKVLDLNVKDDAYKLARLARGAYAAGHQDVMHGVAAYGSGQVVSSSLRDALVIALGKPNVLSGWDAVRMQQFGSYLWSRRALGEWQRFEQGAIPNAPDKLTKGDHAQNVADLEKAFPSFAEAAPLVHEFARALWTKKRDAGLISHQQWEAGMAIVDYVPGLRAFDQAGDAEGRGGKGGGSVKGGLVKRFRGSRRDVLNPLESLMTDAYETANAIARNDSIRALDRLAQRAGPGGGAIAERIPSHQIKALTVDVMETLERAAADNGMAPADYVAIRDMVEGAIGDDAKATLFRPAVINEKGEAIVFFRDGGKLRALRLADGRFGRDMMQALAGMTRAERQAWDIISLPLAKAAAISRLGVVADVPFLIKNFIRDQVQAFVFYGNPAKVLGGAVKGMVAEVAQKDMARAYNAYGGIMGGAAAASVHEGRTRRSLNALARKGWAVTRFTSFKGFLEATELSETGMRLGLFSRFVDEARGRGLSEHEAMLEGAFQARDYIDFDRRGSVITPVARLVPFLNANLQGLDKFTRQMVLPLFREGVTATEQRARGEAVKAWARVSALMVGTLALHAVMSEDDTYTDLDPEQKARNWIFKWQGKYVHIPKPFEVAAFINMAPAIFDGAKRHDPRWAEGLIAGARAAFLPPDILLGNPVVKSATEAYSGNDLSTGNPIIPADRQGLEPFLQYTARTSAFSIALGEAINRPPVVIDQVITNFGTSLGRTLLALSDYATSDKPLPGWDDFVITKAFIKDGSRGASSARAFWDLMATRNGTLEGARRSWEELNNTGDAKAADDFYNRQDETTKAWIALGTAKPEVRRLHPLMRAKAAVTAITALQREMVHSTITTAAGKVEVSRQARGAADDILAKMAMTEQRNAMVMMGVDGWKGREVMETAGYYRELGAVSPELAQALADRFATAKVVPLDAVERLWPEVQARLLRDGGDLLQTDLVARVKGAGFEMDGKAIKRPPRTKAPAGG